MSVETVLDTRQLEERCLGHLAIAASLVEAFFQGVDKDLPELDRALARGDVLRIASMAHRIGRCATKVGAKQTANAAEQIEQSCRKGKLEQLPYQIERFRQAHEEAFSAWISRHSQHETPAPQTTFTSN